MISIPGKYYCLTAVSVAAYLHSLKRLFYFHFQKHTKIGCIIPNQLFHIAVLPLHNLKLKISLGGTAFASKTKSLLFIIEE